MRFFIQNAGWSALHPIKAIEAQQAMSEYRKKHPVCEITGSKNKVQIHHIIPVWADPSLAADPNNFIALSASAHIHIIYGHNGNFARRYVPNIKVIAEKLRAVKQESIIIERPKEVKAKSKILWFDVFLGGFWKS